MNKAIGIAAGEINRLKNALVGETIELAKHHNQ